MNAKDFLSNEKWQASKPGLSRTLTLLEKLGNPQDFLKFIHVVGTNGKGSTCAMTESVLWAAGMKTGMFTSPAIYDFNEQIQVDGVPISEAELDELCELVAPVAESMEDSPTIFEITVALALLYFRVTGCDMVVLEAGMGGEGDATNAITSPEVAVFTPISLDHTQWLGETIEDIAWNKAGIIKSRCRVVVAGENKKATPVIISKAQEADVPVYVVDNRNITDRRADGLRGQYFNYWEYENVFIPFAAPYQVENAATVLGIVRALRKLNYEIPYDAVYEGLAKASWQGRFEVIHEKPLVIVDGSHNPDGMERTVEAVKQHFPGRKIKAVAGMLADKDTEKMLTPLLSVCSELITTEPDNPRALSSSELAKKAELISRIKIVDGGKPASAVKLALEQADEEDIICLIGSLYMISDFRKSVTDFYGGKDECI